MEIIHQLGINSTVFIQLCIFLVTYLVVQNVLFNPYFEAFSERQNKTIGSEEHAVELKKQTQEIYLKFESVARHVNDEINKIYANQKAEAAKESDKILKEAQASSQKLIEEARMKIDSSLNVAQAQLSSEAQQISSVIINKLLAKS